jgi:hypothetical protein
MLGVRDIAATSAPVERGVADQLQSFGKHLEVRREVSGKYRRRATRFFWSTPIRSSVAPASRAKSSARWSSCRPMPRAADEMTRPPDQISEKPALIGGLLLQKPASENASKKRRVTRRAA